jgi:glycerol-3-phosphate O-acyltransferase
MDFPLADFDSIRPRILKDVVDRSENEIAPLGIENQLTTALYLERQRLNRERGNFFTRVRLKQDRALWGEVQKELLIHDYQKPRTEMLKSVVRHYAEEIGGHFSPSIYRFATTILPFGFNMLLNAASFRTLLPWKFKEDVSQRIQMSGEIEHLRKLSQTGTILLVPTHQSNIDSIMVGYIIYLLGLPPFAYGAGLNLFSNPVLSFFMHNLGAYTVDRQKSNPIYKAALKNYSTKILREGVHSIFFPGGGRSRSGAIESHLKLGLLGTALEAQTLHLQSGNPKPNIYIVPMVTSYHFVLEASSLIEDYLADAGKHRYIISDDDSSRFSKVLHFFWQLFKGESGMAVRIGKPLDVFGNFVDEDGKSIGPNGTTIDPISWLTSYGHLGPDPHRDREYTRVLGEKLVTRFHAENTVLTSHLVAFTFFETLRDKYPDLDLYRFLRITLSQRTLMWDDFLKSAEKMHARVVKHSAQGEFHLSDELKGTDTQVWVKNGLKQLGLFHGHAVLKRDEKIIYTEDMNLLYYYRNRLAGYGLSRLADPHRRVPGMNDAKGFLA